MPINSRRKGARGQSEFKQILLERDWSVTATSAGVKQEDLIARDLQGCEWSWEVKKCLNLTLPAFVAQARRQAKARKLPWALACHLHGSRSWLVLRQGERATVWHKREPVA